MRGCQRWRTASLEALREVGAGPADLVLHVALDGALRDAEQVGHGAGAFELLDEVTHLRAGGLGDGAGEGLLDGAVEAVSDDAHAGSPFMIGWAGCCAAITPGRGKCPASG
jgi:hypothetical protein